MRLGIGTPCTSQVIESPIVTLSSSASPTSIEMDTGAARRVRARSPPLPGQEALARHHGVAVGRAILPPERPSRRPALDLAGVAGERLHRAAVHRQDPHRHDRHGGRRLQPPGAEQRVDAGRLVGLDVEQHHVGAAGAAIHPERAQQVELHQEERGEEEGAESEGQHHGHGLVGGPVEIGQPLPPDVRQPVRKPPAERPRPARAPRARVRGWPRRCPPRTRRPGAGCPPAPRPSARRSHPARAPRAPTSGPARMRVAASYGRRSVASGEIRRTPSSGISANATAVQSPSPMPMASAGHDTDGATVTGRKSPSTRGSTCATARPRAAPIVLPRRPMPAACTRKRAKTCRVLPPRQRSTATVSIFCRISTCTALPTPIPPSRSATSATSPRKRPRRSRALPRLRCSSSTVRTRIRSARSDGRSESAMACAFSARREAGDRCRTRRARRTRGGRSPAPGRPG